MTTKQFAEKYGVSIRRVQKLIQEGRIPADKDELGYWRIPDDATYPDDERYTDRYGFRYLYRRSRRPVSDE